MPIANFASPKPNTETSARADASAGRKANLFSPFARKATSLVATRRFGLPCSSKRIHASSASSA